MNYLSLPIVILSAISIYLAVYYLILSIKNELQKPRLVVSAICFFYFIYDCTRIGIYNSDAKFWNYFWFYCSLVTIPIIAIFIIILIVYIYNDERIIWRHDYRIIVAVYAVFAAGLIFEAVLLYPESYTLVLISRIDNTPVHFNINRGAIQIVLQVYVFVSIVYFFIRFYFYHKANDAGKRRIILIIACLTCQFILVIHDILISSGLIPFYLFLGEYGIFFVIIMVTYFSLDPGIFSGLAFLTAGEPAADRVNAGYSHSLLTGINIDDINKKLGDAMKEDKMYADPDITLRSLAEKLSVSYHVLSQLLNSVIGMEFRNYINKYRIEEAKRIIASDPESSIISICYNVGFQSKSAFNNAFKKLTGISPTEFKKNSTGTYR